MSFFITFEGIEGCGKTTQIRRTAKLLQERGLNVLLTREPGGCPIADAVRRILLDPDNCALVPRAELLLYAAARAQHVEEVIAPALSQGIVVLCDRYTDATLAYQGFGRGLDTALIEQLNKVAAGSFIPHLTVLLDMPEEEGLERARRRNIDAAMQIEERFEREALSFHRRVREGYLKIAENQERFRILDARGSEEEVFARIVSVIDPFLAEARS
jgi:dTMP kinase